MVPFPGRGFPMSVRCHRHAARMTTRTLSHSGRTDFQLCQRKFYLGREKGLRRKQDPAARRMGKWFAHVLDAGDDTHLPMVQEAYRTAETDDEARIIGIENEIVRLLSRAYRDWYGDFPASTIREYEFRDPIAGHGFIDALVSDPTSGNTMPVRAIEDKLLTAHFWRTADAEALDVDPQLTAYFYAMRSMGTPLREYEFRATMKPGLYIKVGDDAASYGERLAADIAKRPEFYFRSYIQTRTDQQLDEFELEAKDISRQYAAARRSNTWPKAPKVVCSLYGGCDFLPICRGSYNPDDYETQPRWPEGTNDRQKLCVRVLNDAFLPAVPTADVAKQMGVDARGAAATLRACERKGLVEVTERDEHDNPYWGATRLGAAVASGGR